MEDDYDLSGVPFFNPAPTLDFGLPTFNDETNIDQFHAPAAALPPALAPPAVDVDQREVQQLRENIQRLEQQLASLERLLVGQMSGASLFAPAGGPGPAKPAAAEPAKRNFWTREEHFLFLKQIQKYGRQNTKEVAGGMNGVRSLQQVRTHAQKYFDKLDKWNAEARQATARIVGQVGRQIAANYAGLRVQLSAMAFAEPEPKYEQLFLQLFSGADRQRPLFSLDDEQSTPFDLASGSQTPGHAGADVFAVVGPLFALPDAQISKNPIPFPLVILSNAQRVLRQVYPDQIPYGGYFVTESKELQALVLLAVSGNYKQALQQQNGFVQCVYQKDSNELLVEKTTPLIKFNMSSIDFDASQVEFLQLNSRPFVKYCAAYMSAHCGDPQFLRDFVLAIELSVKQIQNVADPFDYVLERVAKTIQRSVEDVSLYIFCYCALWACYQVERTPGK